MITRVVVGFATLVAATHCPFTAASQVVVLLPDHFVAVLASIPLSFDDETLALNTRIEVEMSIAHLIIWVFRQQKFCHFCM